MKRVLLAAILAVWAPAAMANPRQNIEALLEKQAEAWTRGDLDAFCSAYADDVTFVSPHGITKGRQRVLDRYREKYVEDKSGMGSLTLEVQEIRLAGNANASVIARWTLRWPDKEKSEGLTLLVLAKIEGRWRIVQDASM